jgi:hypothetical protein
MLELSPDHLVPQLLRALANGWVSSKMVPIHLIEVDLFADVFVIPRYALIG